MPQDLRHRLLNDLDRQAHPVALDDIQMHRPRAGTSRRPLVGASAALAAILIVVVLVYQGGQTNRRADSDSALGPGAATSEIPSHESFWTSSSGVEVTLVVSPRSPGIDAVSDRYNLSSDADRRAQLDIHGPPASPECYPEVSLGGTLRSAGESFAITGWFPAWSSGPAQAAPQLFTTSDETETVSAYVVRLRALPALGASRVDLLAQGQLLDSQAPQGEWVVLAYRTPLVVPYSTPELRLGLHGSDSSYVELSLDSVTDAPGECPAATN